MKFFITTLVAALVASAPAVLAQLTINTPANVVECEPTQLTWSGGQTPYYLSLVPAGQPSATPLMQFPNQNGTSYTWMVDLQAGTNFNIALKDGTGATAYSDIITVQAGSSTSCATASVSGASATSGSTAAATTGGSGATAGSTSATSSASSSAASSKTTATSSSNGADRVSISTAFGVGAVMSLVGAALF
ncbi:hypothetical protein BKA82DRAFT_4072159 [Pisolithus tinctorius]|nr:hypothetical protein BKA82DRAFT_4072159 [Pisolithus tinctorius]